MEIKYNNIISICMYIYTALVSGDTVLIINTQPSDNEQSYEGVFFRCDYRSGITSGTTVDDTLLNYCMK